MPPIAILPPQAGSASTAVASAGAQSGSGYGPVQSVLQAALAAPDAADPSAQAPTFAMLLPAAAAQGDQAGDLGALMLLPPSDGSVQVVDPALDPGAQAAVFPLPASEGKPAADDDMLALLASLVASAQQPPPLPMAVPVAEAADVPAAALASVAVSAAGWQLATTPTDLSAMPVTAAPIGPSPVPVASGTMPNVPIDIGQAAGSATAASPADMGTLLAQTVQQTAASPVPAVDGSVPPALPPSAGPAVATVENAATPSQTQPVVPAAAPAAAPAMAEMVQPAAAGTVDEAGEAAAVAPGFASVAPRPVPTQAGVRRQAELRATASAPQTGVDITAAPTASAAITASGAVRPAIAPAAVRQTVDAPAAGDADAQAPAAWVPDQPVALAESPVVPLADHHTGTTPSIEAQDIAAADVEPIQAREGGGTSLVQDAFGDLGTSQRSGPVGSSSRAEQPSAPRSEPNPMERAVANQVSRAIIQHLPDGGTRMVMRLTPPELGTVRVEFVIRDGTMTARLLAEDDGVRQALDRALPQIRSDVRTEHPTLDITVDRSDQRQSWQDSQTRQDQRGEQPSGSRQRQGDGDEVFSLDGAEPAQIAQPLRPERVLGGQISNRSVDAFA